MINEAFWLFYFADLVEELSFLFGLGAGILGIATLIFGIFGNVTSDMDSQDDKDEQARFRGIGFKTLIACVSLSVLSSIMPSKDAIYAGAAQYAVEVTDTDETLKSLKRIIDEKIEAIGDDDGS